VKLRALMLASTVLLLAGLAAEPAGARRGPQQGPFMRARQARLAGAAQKENPNALRRNPASPNANGAAAKALPNARAMAGLPPKWVENLQDMPPEDQERFMENNERFKSLTPERQDQIRKNLQKWNSLPPEQQAALRKRETVLEQMTPEQRQYFTNTVLPKWQAMPQDRRQAINRHLAMLSNMSPATQQAVLNDPRFLQGLSPEEQSMLRDLNSLRNPSTP
jgi:hypothetical protein